MTKIIDRCGVQFEKSGPKPDSAKKSGETDRDLDRDADKFSNLIKKPRKESGEKPVEKRDAAGDSMFEKSGPKPDSAKKSGETVRDPDMGADNFPDLMKKPRKKTGEMPGEKREAAGDSILQAFQSRQADTPVEPAAAMDSRSKISDVATQIADRILVSDASLDGKQEVRIQLKESVLPGTEVRISKEGGGIRVELATVNADSYRFLSEQQTSLQDHLKSRIGENVQVQVTTAETRGDTHDGRSRQQRDLYEELQDRED